MDRGCSGIIWGWVRSRSLIKIIATAKVFGIKSQTIHVFVGRHSTWLDVISSLALMLTPSLCRMSESLFLSGVLWNPHQLHPLRPLIRLLGSPLFLWLCLPSWISWDHITSHQGRSHLSDIFKVIQWYVRSSGFHWIIDHVSKCLLTQKLQSFLSVRKWIMPGNLIPARQ